MNITRENYEAFFLDYHEGTLSEKQQKELKDFLVENPDLKTEFESFEMITLSDDTPLPAFDKESLKKPVAGKELQNNTSNDLENLMIAYYEGDISEAEKGYLMKTLASDPQARKSFELFGKVYLEADTSIVFPNKSSLKRYTLGAAIIQFRRIAVAAALVAIMISLYVFLPRISLTPELAETYTPAPLIPSEILEEPVIGDYEELAEEQLLTPAGPSSRPRYPERATIATEFSQDAQFAVHERLAASLPSGLDPFTRTSVQSATKPSNIEKRTEFYWFTYITGEDLLAYDDYYVDEEEDLLPPTQTRGINNLSLASIAYEGIERSTGIDIRAIEEQISDRRFGLWDIAGYGLAGISQITGSSLAVEKERDENGRIRSLGIGERFRISR